MATTSNRDGMPRLDEATFQKLLAAAYVIQEHRRHTEPEPSSGGNGMSDAEYATTLAEIVETQQQIRLQHLDLDAAAGLVVEQVHTITAAAGVAICLLDHDHLIYRAVSGISVAAMGQALPRAQSISQPVLSNGVVLRCADALTDAEVDPMIAQRAGIASFLSVPIFHDKEVAGALELVFTKPNGYHEHDLRTCQLMAGLVTECLTRTADQEWKQSLTAERDSMLEALEKLKPQLDRLAKDAEALSASATTARKPAAYRAEPTPYESVIKPPPLMPRSPRNVSPSASRGDTEACHRCGHEVSSEEVYCGNCGSLRSDRSRGDLAARTNTSDTRIESPASPAGTSTVNPGPPRASFSTNLVDHEMQLPNEVLALAKDQATEQPEQDVASELMKLLPPDPDGAGIEPASNYSMPSASITSSIPPQIPPQGVPTSETYPWTSAAHARAWLNTVADPKAETGIAALLERHRGDLSLGTAIVALLIALFWGMNHHSRQAPPARVTSAPAAAVSGAAPPTQEAQEAPPARKQSDPQADLSPMERALIALGLAEPPPAPKEYGGNPDIKVWVDLRTALYYCPTSELYGKTPKGKFVSQREAQIDQFEPASRKACE